MTQSLQKIYSDFRAGFQENADFTIGFFSEHSLFLNNIKAFKDKEDLRLFIELTWQYINANYRKNRFNDVIDHADKKLEFIDSEISRLSVLDLKDSWYYGILFLKGISSYELRDYKTSTRIRYLIKIDDRNDNYKKWLGYSRYGEQQWLVRVLSIVFGLMIVIAVLFRGFIPSASRFAILGIGVLGLTANWGYEHYVRRSFRKGR